MINVVSSLLDKNRKDLAIEVSKYIVKSYAAKGYAVIGEGDRALFINTPGNGKEISYIIARDRNRNKYYVLATKRKAIAKNFDITLVSNIYRHLNKKPVNTIKYLAEEYAKEKGFLKYFKSLPPDKFTKLILTKEGFSYKFFKKWFPELEITEKEAEEKVHNFDIVYDDSVKDIDKDSIIEFLEKASKYIEDFGLSKLLYGKIFVLDKLPGRVIALYETSSDLIKLSRKASKKYNKDMAKFFIHELGHRLWEKSSVNKQAVRDLYNQVKLGFLRSDIKVGDVYRDNYNRKVEVKDIDKSKGIILYVVDKEGIKIPQKIPGAAFNYMDKVKGKPKEDINSWIPSSYALKGGFVEYFCEVFAHGLVNDNKKCESPIMSFGQ